MTSLIFDILNSNYLHFVSFTDHLKGKIIQRQIQRAALGKSITFQTGYNRANKLSPTAESAWEADCIFYDSFLPLYSTIVHASKNMDSVNYA